MNFIELVAQQGSLPFRCVGIAQRLITIQVRNGEKPSRFSECPSHICGSPQKAVTNPSVPSW